MINKSMYVVSKPLQYINATNIPDENVKDCLIVNAFSGADYFYSRVSNDSCYWDKVFYVSDVNEMIKFLMAHKKEYLKLYIFSDQSLKLFLFLRRMAPMEIYTYEEGFGSYRKLRDTRFVFERLKVLVFKIMGTDNWFGSSYFIKGIYLYHPNVFNKLIPENKKSVYPFKKTLGQRMFELEELKYLYRSIDLNEFEGKNVLVYLSSWGLNEKVNSILEEHQQYVKVLKLHPHIKTNLNMNNNFDYVLDNILPSEIFLNLVSKCCRKLLVIHDNTSSLIYLDNNLFEDINIGESRIRKVYDEIREHIKNDNELN